MAQKHQVVIAGAGLAGMSAAIHLADRGIGALVLETRKRPGGRATSFDDPRTGERLDNCQHVALGCCTNYLAFLERLGTLDKIAWSNDQLWAEAGGRFTSLRTGLFPAPGHYTEAFAAAKFLALSEKAAIARALLHIARVKDADLKGKTFADLLAATNQPESTVRKFWAPVIISACNLAVDRVDAAPAVKVFREGFLASAKGAAIGVPSVPLVDLYQSAASIIESAGGQIIHAFSVGSISETTVTDARTDENIEAEHLISALPFERLAAAATEDLRQIDPRIAPLDRLAHSPILGIHLRFDRPILEPPIAPHPAPHAVLVDRPTQWLFRKHDDPRMIHAVVSAADDWLDLDEQAITDRVLADIHACFPASVAAELLSARAVKEKRATFAATPESETIRPPQTHPSSRLILAGDYTTTGWPATMEGAVRSGRLAAAAILGEDPNAALESELEPARISRALVRGL